MEGQLVGGVLARKALSMEMNFLDDCGRWF